MALHDLDKALNIQKLVPRFMRFGQAVGIQHQRVANLRRQAGLFGNVFDIEDNIQFRKQLKGDTINVSFSFLVTFMQSYDVCGRLRG